MKNKILAAQKAFFLGLSLLCGIINLHAANYYFSTSLGNDSRSFSEARNPATPWKSIEKLNAILNQLNPGDAILFKSGETFYGSILINKSGGNGTSITFSSYDNGSKPQITGFTGLSNWANAGGNVWETTLPKAQQNLFSVTVNGTQRRVGRYPNFDAANSGYLSFESTSGNNSITDLQLGSSPNWTGGEVVIRKVRWVLDRNVITQHQQNTIRYNSQSGYGANAGYGYFIQNHPQTLDQNTEWYYQANNQKFGIYSTSGEPTANSVQVSTIPSLVTINNQSNITFSNLIFSGANENAFYIRNSQNVVIKDCDILFSGHDAVNALNSNYVSVENTTINNTNNVACNLENCNNIVLRKNKIANSGTIAGMGDGDSGGYEALLLSGNNQLIEGNTIDSSGYIAITFRGENVAVKNNVVRDFSFVKDDGSGIYTWNNPSNPPVYTNRSIIGNIVLNGSGAGAGTPEPDQFYANGIYMDDNAGGVEISGNTVANCANYGFYFHNAHDLVVKNNTVYNNKVQLNMTQDDIASSPIANVTLTGNTFVSKLASQSVAEFKTNANNISNFGNFDYNYYSRPLNDNLQIGVLQKENGNYVWSAYDLEGWKVKYGKDQNSKKSPFPIAPFKVNNTIGANLFGNGSFDNNIGGLYSYSSANNMTASWNNTVLDGGALQVSFSSTNNINNNAMVVIGIGAIAVNKKYILKFSLKGTSQNKVMGAYLRQSNAPYTDLVTRNYLTISGDRTEKEILLTPTFSESNASIGFEIPEQNTPVYFDNVQLIEANVTVTNPDDSIRFVYNPEAVSRSFALANSYADIANNSYNSNINLAPYSSAVLLKKSAAGPEEVVCSATGYILREQWNNIGGNDVNSIPLQTPPTSSSQLTIFEAPTDIADNYGARIRGYICPPQTGNYTFWIASDDGSELWLSTDDNVANRSRIAYSLGWTNPREWNKYPTQKSTSIYLQAGRKYYIEALHKEGGGGDNLSVAWQLPSGGVEAPIPGSRLSPFTAAVTKTDQTINFAAIANQTYGDAPFTVSANATSGLPVSFSIVSGPATVSGNTVTLTSSGTVVIKASQDGNTLYNAATPVTQNFIVNPAAVANCSATGYILREQWNNIGGNDVNSIPLQTAPTSSSQLTIFEAPTDFADNYGARIRGYICPPQTGNYTFWIASDDGSELWLSTSDNPSNKTKIAYSLSWTNSREWNKYASQKSASIYLQAGQKYYIEALHKEGAGGDNLSVAWQLPNGNVEAPISGSRLSPFIVVENTPACSGTGSIVREQWNNINGHSINSIPLQTVPASTMQLTSFESPTNVAENFGARIRGYICPPQTGNYTFWIAADDVAELWLSTSDAENNKVKIASVPSYTDMREWNKYASQKSVTIYLQAGYKYYIEALHKEGDGGDNLAVAWQLPNSSIEAPVPGSRLSPFIGANTIVSAFKSIMTSSNDIADDNPIEQLTGIEQPDIKKPLLKVYPNPIVTSAIIEVNLPENDRIKLDLYDEQGRIVKQFYNGMISKGNTEKISLNAGKIAGGIYLVRLVTPSKVVTKKIVIRK